MSARMPPSRSNISPVNWRSNSTRRAHWRSASAPAGPAFPASLPRPAPARRTPRARGPKGSTAPPMCWEADREGNLIYRKTARNFNPIMATAAVDVVVEVEELVDYGQIDPDQIITPGIFVNRIVPLATVDKRIEQRTVRKRY